MTCPLLCIQYWTPDDGRRNCPKYVELYSKNKFEKLVHLVGFVVRIYHDARSHVTMHGHISRYTVTCHDARSHVTIHGPLNVKLLIRIHVCAVLVLVCTPVCAVSSSER